MQKRGTDEEVARSLIEDVMGSIPQNTRAVICGDWNARVGNLHPKIGDIPIERKSDDMTIGIRASWVINMCEEKQWYILNGL